MTTPCKPICPESSEYEYTLDDGVYIKGARVMLFDKLPTPKGWVKVSQLPGPSMPAHGTLSVPHPWGTVPDTYGPTLEGKRLTAEGERLYREWDHLYRAEGCKCDGATGVVCPHCIHPGHPYSLEHNTKVWEDLPVRTRADAIMDAIRQAAGKSGTE